MFASNGTEWISVYEFQLQNSFSDQLWQKQTREPCFDLKNILGSFKHPTSKTVSDNFPTDISYYLLKKILKPISK